MADAVSFYVLAQASRGVVAETRRRAALVRVFCSAHVRPQRAGVRHDDHIDQNVPLQYVSEVRVHGVAVVGGGERSSDALIAASGGGQDGVCHRACISAGR